MSPSSAPIRSHGGKRRNCFATFTLSHARPVHACASNTGQHLARLREALEETATLASGGILTADTDATDVLTQWYKSRLDGEEEAIVTSPQARQSSQTRQQRKGVRRLQDAIEYDLSLYEEPDGSSDDENAAVPNHKRLPRVTRYFDTASINVTAGDGGQGCCAFRREACMPHGGPSGGNGGHGGSIWAEADEALTSLVPFRNRVHWKADKGVNGQGKDLHGANGEDLTIRVPRGTIIRQKGDAGDLPALAELLQHVVICNGADNEERPYRLTDDSSNAAPLPTYPCLVKLPTVRDRALIVQGGRGGRGNAAFKSSRNSAPVTAEDGERGESMWVDMELKLVADVGVIGMPSAGKSTLLRAVSSAKPKIAAYPFTTLRPNLGVCELDMRTTVFADVPGLIEGAHLGRGLGHEFLRHVSRARALVHVLDGTALDAVADFRTIRAELSWFGGAELMRKPYIVAYNKIDLPDSGDYVDDVAELLEEVRTVRKMLDSMPDTPLQPSVEARNLQTKKKVADFEKIGEYEIESDFTEGRVWLVHGAALHRFAQMTDWNYFESALRFHRVLKACGLWAEMERRGAQVGDSVVIGELEFAWTADQSENEMYGAWADERKAQGRIGKGSARWPHAGG